MINEIKPQINLGGIDAGDVYLLFEVHYFTYLEFLFLYYVDEYKHSDMDQAIYF